MLLTILMWVAVGLIAVGAVALFIVPILCFAVDAVADRLSLLISGHHWRYHGFALRRFG